MATTKDYRLGEFTFPRGWFMIADGEELYTHKPLAVRFFGKDFALYRGRETGKVVLLDAYCPHMKTHLAAPNNTSYVVVDGGGSNVEGDSIRCPYHARRFGPTGSEKRAEPYDLGVFTHCGIDPRRKKFVLIKSRQHFRAGFEPIAKHIVMCDGEGCTASDLGLFKYTRIRRPLYPFDPDMRLGRNEG